MTMLNIFKYKGEYENPVSEKINLQKQLFGDDIMGIAHIYPEQNILFIESDQSIRKQNIPMNDIAHFVPNRDNFYNFFKQISNNIEKLTVISSSGNSYDVVERNELNSTLDYKDKPIMNAEFKYKNKKIYYESHVFDVPNDVPKTELMTKFSLAVRNQI